MKLSYLKRSSVLLFALLLAGCKSPYATIERASGAGPTYRFTDPELRHRISFEVPKDWTLSHWPNGGTAGCSSFANTKQSGALLLVVAYGETNVDATISQEAVFDDWLKTDREHAKDRVIEWRRELARQPESILIKIPEGLETDVAEFKRVAEQQVVDGRVIWIVRLASPLRSEWLQCFIPESGFTVEAMFHSFEELSDRDVALMKSFLASYRRVGDSVSAVGTKGSNHE